MAQFTIKRLGHQGNGIADDTTGQIFVPFSLPGEVIEGELDGKRILSPKIITPSSDRVRPSCSHFKACGGCALQHGSDDFLARWKVETVKSALAAQGIEAPFHEIITSPAASRRRATLAGTRTKKGAIVGFHGRASNTVIDIPNCTLLHPEIVKGLSVLKALTILGASRKNLISLRITQSDVGLDISVMDAKKTDGALLAHLGQLVERHNLARLSWNGEVIATRVAPVQKFQDIAVIPPSGAFLQATVAGQNALIASVGKAVGKAARIVDLFAGCGTFTLPLAHQSEILAVEAEQSALASLDAAWRKTPGLKTVTTEARDLFRRPLLADELAKFQAAIIDPPRAGAKAQVEVLAQSEIAKIAFVSCNPVTFARDAATLIAAGYLLDWVQVIDQFHWSPHVELVASFHRP
ncbi:MAG: class I SAM-dependent RNA methyltransferase [Alphaproteobacteria bacterium]|nr:class I SAM-dependent RNA methyltransferase [Alphaproteobacteria bacterium]